MPALIRRARFRAPFQDLPIDVLPHILSHLTDRHDWHSCTLVSKAFNRLATPFLYRTLDSRIISKTLLHPSSTLLKRPHLARYVRHVTETGGIHRAMLTQYPTITQDTLAALALCTNLRSITWIDDCSTTDTTLLAFLDVVRTLPLRELTIRTHSDLGETVWAQLISLTGLRKVSIWCMEGPPRVLQGWSGPLGSTLTHLELGRCAGVPPTILITVLSQLPLLKDLRLKGAPASSIPTILKFLPNLRSLDTEYLGSYYPSQRKAVPPVPPAESNAYAADLPRLRHLTVRTSSMDNLGPQPLWGWIRELAPRAGLETFRLQAYTFNNGDAGIPRRFVLDLALAHGATLKHFLVGESHMTLSDVECLCSKFPNLETLVCSVSSPDVDSIIHAIAGAMHLQTLTLQVKWIPGDARKTGTSISVEDAKRMMLRSKDSKLRTISVGHYQYTGKWVLHDEDDEKLQFIVCADKAGEGWHT